MNRNKVKGPATLSIQRGFNKIMRLVQRGIAINTRQNILSRYLKRQRHEDR